jgi:predicted transcriptional regulator
MKTMSLKLPEELDSRLTAIARRRGERRSAIVRQSLRAYLDAAGEAAGQTCLELVADLAGCVKGPQELSANPKHLRGYGK